MPFLRKESANWWIHFTAPNGKRISRSSRTTDFEEAKKLEAQARDQHRLRINTPPEGHRRCTQCTRKAGKNVFKPIDAFQPHSSWCRACSNDYAKAQYKLKKRQAELAARNESGRVLFEPDLLGLEIHRFMVQTPIRPRRLRPIEWEAARRRQSARFYERLLLDQIHV